VLQILTRASLVTRSHLGHRLSICTPLQPSFSQQHHHSSQWTGRQMGTEPKKEACSSCGTTAATGNSVSASHPNAEPGRPLWAIAVV